MRPCTKEEFHPFLNDRGRNDGVIKISFPISSSPGALSALLSFGSPEGEKGKCRVDRQTEGEEEKKEREN